LHFLEKYALGILEDAAVIGGQAREGSIRWQSKESLSLSFGEARMSSPLGLFRFSQSRERKEEVLSQARDKAFFVGWTSPLDG